MMYLFDNRAHRPRSIGFRIGGVDVGVASRNELVLEDFERLYEGFPRAGVHPSSSVWVEVRDQPRTWARSCRVFGDGEAIGPSVCAAHVLPFVEWGINYRLVARRDEFLQIHAAVLARRGRAVLFAAQSGSGKSTLAAGLLARNWNYLSDEIALIDPKTLYVHPFPKALCIKSGAFDDIRGLDLPFVGRRYYVKGAKGHVAYVNPLCVGTDVIGSACPVRYLIFPRFVPGCRPRVTRISAVQAAFELARNAMNRTAFGDRAAAACARLARQCDCYALRSGELAETCDLLDALFDERDR